MPRSPKNIKKPTTVAPTTAPTPRLLPPQPPRPLPEPPRPTPPALTASRITSSTISSVTATSSRPVRQSALRALEIIKQKNKTDSGTDGEDSDWSVNEDGVDDDLTECLYDFFKDEKKSDKVNADVYTYIMNVMDDKEEYDPDNSKMIKLKALIPAINIKFKNYYKEIEEGGKAPEITMKLLEKHIEAGLDDDYEDDGWIVNDI